MEFACEVSRSMLNELICSKQHSRFSRLGVMATTAAAVVLQGYRSHTQEKVTAPEAIMLHTASRTLATYLMIE
jgi:hypothetical protein